MGRYAFLWTDQGGREREYYDEVPSAASGSASLKDRTRLTSWDYGRVPVKIPRQGGWREWVRQWAF